MSRCAVASCFFALLALGVVAELVDFSTCGWDDDEELLFQVWEVDIEPERPQAGDYVQVTFRGEYTGARVPVRPARGEVGGARRTAGPHSVGA